MINISRSTIAEIKIISVVDIDFDLCFPEDVGVKILNHICRKSHNVCSCKNCWETGVPK